MNLNYILGMPRSGKSSFIYNQIKKDLNNTDKNLILIVPEQTTYEKEKELIEFLNVKGIMKAQVVSFTRLEYKILEEVGGIKEKEINDYGKIMLLREVFESNKKNLKVFGRAYLKEGFLKNFNTLIKEFKDGNIDLDYLDKFEGEKYDAYGFSRKIEDIKIIYRDLPILGEDSIALSLAGRCAGEQGKFWNMIDKLLERQGEFELEELPDIAEQIGANRLQFINCMAEERYLGAIRQDMKDADTMNIDRTPTYMFNEYKASGHIEKDQFELYINNLLENN